MPRIFTVIAVSLPLIGIASAQGKKPVAIPSPGSQSWKKTTMTAATLAAKVAAATAGLKSTTAMLTVLVRTPEGEGMFLPKAPGKPDGMTVQALDNRHYRVDYVTVQKLPFSGTLVNDGTRRGIRADTKVVWMKATDRLPAAKAVGDHLVSLFEMDFSRLAFQGFTEGVDAWKSVIGGWAKGVNGYKPVVEERRVRLQGHDFLSYRIRTERAGPAVKKLGKSTIEVVIDGHRFLPVTIRVVRTDPKGKEWLAQWNAAYAFNQKIAAKDMQLGVFK